MTLHDTCHGRSCMDERFRPRQPQPVIPPSNQPALRLHSAVVALLSFLVAVYVVPPLIFTQWEAWSAYALAFIPARIGSLTGFPQMPGAAYWTMLTHSFLHGNVSHLAANALWLVTFGTPLARVVGTVRFFVIAAVAAIAGSLATLVVHWGEFIMLVGASGAISGMLGALVPLMFAEGGSSNIRAERAAPKIMVMPIASLFSDRRALGFMANFLVFTFVTGAAQILAPTALLGDFNIAWESHLGGFLAGLALIYLLAPRAVSRNT